MDRLRLGVNIDHVATLRQARGGPWPDPVYAAGICLVAGADGITVHLREDRRHIQDRDVRMLRDACVPHLNMEMAATDEMVDIARKIRPDAVCVVPEKREELTTEGGLDVAGAEDRICKVTRSLRDAGIWVSLFIEADERQIEAAARVGATHVELHTGAYANAPNETTRVQIVDQLVSSAVAAHKAGLRVNAGHGIDYWNMDGILEIPFLEELNIGYAIVCRAVLAGLEPAVRDMVELMSAYDGGRIS
jgi:pyridoxine 5-phosphate synthase